MKKFLIYGFINDNPVLITNSQNLSFASTFDETMSLQRNMKSSLSFKITDKLESGETNPFLGLVYPNAHIRLKVWENVDNDPKYHTYDYIITNISSEFYKEVLVYNISAEDFASTVYSKEGQGMSIDSTGTLRELTEEILFKSRKNLIYRNLYHNYFSFATYRNAPTDAYIDYSNFLYTFPSGSSAASFEISRDKGITSILKYRFGFRVIIGGTGNTNFSATLEQYNISGTKIGTDCTIVINNNIEFSEVFLVQDETKYFKIVFNMNTTLDKQVLISLFSFYLEESYAEEVAFDLDTGDSIYAILGKDDLTQSLYLSDLYNENDFISEISYNGEYDIITFQKSTLTLDNSNLYNSLVEVAKLFNADLIFDYELGTVNFLNRDKYIFKGYKLNPEFNLLTLSREERTEELATVLHIRGSEDVLSSIPEMPPAFQSYFNDCIENDFTGSLYFETFELVYDYTLGSSLYPAGEVHNFTSAAAYIKNTPKYVNGSFTPIKAIEIDNFASVADKIPQFENTLYSLDYFMKSGKITQTLYDNFNKYVNDSLRKINIKSQIFSNRYYSNDTILSTKKSEIDFYTTNINVEERFLSDVFKNYEYVQCTSANSGGIVKFATGSTKVLNLKLPVLVVLLNNSDAYPTGVLKDNTTTRGYYAGNTTPGQTILYKDKDLTQKVDYSSTQNVTFYLFIAKDQTNSTITYAQLYTAYSGRIASRTNQNKYFASLFQTYGVAIDIGNPWTGLDRTHSIVLENGKLPVGSYLASLLDNYGYTNSSINGVSDELDKVNDDIQELTNNRKNYVIRLTELNSLINIPVTTTGTITVSSISGAGTAVNPWVATISATTIDTSKLYQFAEIKATNGTGSLFGGNPQSVLVDTIGVNTFTYKVVGGTTPIAGTITNLMVYPTSDTKAAYEAEKAGIENAIKSIDYKILIDSYDLVAASATIGTVTGTGTALDPWTATISGLTDTTLINVGASLIATNGTGRLYAGSPTYIRVTIVNSTSFTFQVVGAAGTNPVAGIITNLQVFSAYPIFGSLQHQKFILAYILQDIAAIPYIQNGIEPLYDKLYNEYSPNNIKNEKDAIVSNFYKVYERYIIENYYENTDEVTAEGLLAQSLVVFNRYKYPRIDFGVSIIDITALQDYEYIDLSIGDLILIQEENDRLYKSYAPENTKYLQLSQINYDLRRPEGTSLTVAQDDETKKILQKLMFTISGL